MDKYRVTLKPELKAKADAMAAEVSARRADRAAQRDADATDALATVEGLLDGTTPLKSPEPYEPVTMRIVTQRKIRRVTPE